MEITGAGMVMDRLWEPVGFGKWTAWQIWNLWPPNVFVSRGDVVSLAALFQVVVDG